MFKSVFRSFVFSRALVAAFAALAYFLIPSVTQGIDVPLTGANPWFLSMWYHWDANWYMSIAADGYHWLPGDQSNVAFFPLYPLVVRALGLLMGDNFLLAGMALSSLFLCGGMLFMYRLIRDDFGADIAGRAVFLMVIFPTAVFFTTMYSESLFLLTSIAAFYYARRNRWVLAGCWGLLAAMTRVSGLWLLLPLAWELLSQKGFSPRKLAPGAVSLLLLPGGLGLYMLFLYLKFDRPFAFAETQVTGWGHELATPWAAVSRDLGYLTQNGEYWVIYELLASAFLVVCLLLGLRRLRGSYNIYILVSLLGPVLSGTTRSMSRYLLVVFPVFILMAQLTKKPVARYAVYAVSLVLLAVATGAFATGRWVA
ncbi:MAG: mannosyltransferase family protein [Thermoleophilia bacterium]